MKYFLWLYLANILNRVRFIGVSISRVSLLFITIAYFSLATHQQPTYYQIVLHYIHLAWLIFAISLLLVFVPSEKYILNILMIYKRDEFMRNSIISKIFRVIKYTIKYDWFNMPYRKSIYQSLINAKRIKWLCILMYLYDLYKGFAKALQDVWYIIVVYFGFVVATWLYVKLTGTQLYYYSTIHTSVDWLIAIASFLIFKIIFIPSFSVIKKMLIKVIVAIVRDKFGISIFEEKLNTKLMQFEQRGEQNV